VHDNFVLSSLLETVFDTPELGFDWLLVLLIKMFIFLELLLSQLVGVVYPESTLTGLSKGQGLTKDTLEDVTDADDL